jgi:hypothetical protein
MEKLFISPLDDSAERRKRLAFPPYLPWPMSMDTRHKICLYYATDTVFFLERVLQNAGKYISLWLYSTVIVGWWNLSTSIIYIIWLMLTHPLHPPSLKGTVSQDFQPSVFPSITPRPLINTLKYFRFLFRIRRAITEYVFVPRYAA